MPPVRPLRRRSPRRRRHLTPNLSGYADKTYIICGKGVHFVLMKMHDTLLLSVRDLDPASGHRSDPNSDPPGAGGIMEFGDLSVALNGSSSTVVKGKEVEVSQKLAQDLSLKLRMGKPVYASFTAKIHEPRGEYIRLIYFRASQFVDSHYVRGRGLVYPAVEEGSEDAPPSSGSTSNDRVPDPVPVELQCTTRTPGSSASTSTTPGNRLLNPPGSLGAEEIASQLQALVLTAHQWPGTGAKPGTFLSTGATPSRLLGTSTMPCDLPGTSLRLAKSSGTSTTLVKSTGTRTTPGKSPGTSSLLIKSPGTSSLLVKSPGTSSLLLKSPGTSSLLLKSPGTSSLLVKSPGTSSMLLKSTGTRTTPGKSPGTRTTPAKSPATSAPPVESPETSTTPVESPGTSTTQGKSPGTSTTSAKSAGSKAPSSARSSRKKVTPRRGGRKGNRRKKR